MKKLFFILILAGFVAACSDDLTADSAGTDDKTDGTEVPGGSDDGGTGTDEGQDGTDVPEDPDGDGNISVETSPFAGYWTRSSNSNWNNYYYLFRPDGSCESWIYDSYDEVMESPDYGSWSYDPDTKILATTLSGEQWQVTIVTDNQWSGIALHTESTSHTFTRLTDVEMVKYIVPGDWVFTSDSSEGYTTEKSFSKYDSIYDSENYVIPSGNIYDSRHVYGTYTYWYWTYSENDDEYDGKCIMTDTRYDRDDDNDYYSRVISETEYTLTVLNPYSQDDCILIYEDEDIRFEGKRVNLSL